MTGAPVPRGADAVIPYERTEQLGASVRIFAPVAPGDCIFPPGEDFRRGDELIVAASVFLAGQRGHPSFARHNFLPVLRPPPRPARFARAEHLFPPPTTPPRPAPPT